jgi:superfamily I DNA and RNA helicase
MKWLKKLFTAEEIDIAPSDISCRVSEIQFRIATLRRSIEQPEKSYSSSSSSSKLVVDTTPQQSIADARATKAAELNDIKSKLLGKKL